MRTGSRLALAVTLAVAALTACGGGADGPQVTGSVSSLVPTFCVQAADGSRCFVTAQADGVKQGELKVGECVQVTYDAATEDADAATATEVARSSDC